jgi:hypothetical protein
MLNALPLIGYWLWVKKENRIEKRVKRKTLSLGEFTEGVWKLLSVIGYSLLLAPDY